MYVFVSVRKEKKERECVCVCVVFLSVSSHNILLVPCKIYHCVVIFSLCRVLVFFFFLPWRNVTNVVEKEKGEEAVLFVKRSKVNKKKRKIIKNKM